MKTSIKAPLLSGLVFPGLGHFVVKQYLRGSVLVFVTLAALAELVASAFQQAETIVERINSGDIPVDASTLAEMASGSASSAQGLADNIAGFVLLACWVVGIVDSCRIAIRREKSGE